ncbi:MAG: hypothetical protein NTV89_07375 [Proteobacteria bacterium]|nr:hypothetical protein [Pseudomonadota bacterium]
MKEEIIIFGSLYLASRLMYWFWFDKRDRQAPRFITTRQHYLEKLSRITVIIILLCAGATQYLRNNRIELFYQARTIILTSNNYIRALELLTGADRWPYGAEQASVEYYKARAYRGLGDFKQAEQHYLASLAEDPRNFNSIGDLALLYASGKEDAALRRSRAEPYVKQLLAYHATHQGIKGYLKKIGAALGVPADAGYAARIPAENK